MLCDIADISRANDDRPGGRSTERPVYRLDAVVLAKGGARWADQLVESVAGIVADWGITIGTQLHGGTSASVTEVVTAYGDSAVLKIAVPGVDVELQIATLVAAGGRGYVRVIAADPARRAMLLEPLGISLQRSVLSPTTQLGVLASLLPLARQVPTRGDPAQDKAGELIGSSPISASAGTPGSSTKPCGARNGVQCPAVSLPPHRDTSRTMTHRTNTDRPPAFHPTPLDRSRTTTAKQLRPPTEALEIVSVACSNLLTACYRRITPAGARGVEDQLRMLPR